MQVLKQKQLDSSDVQQVSVRRFSSFNLFSRSRITPTETDDPSDGQWVEYRSATFPQFSALLRYAGESVECTRADYLFVVFHFYLPIVSQGLPVLRDGSLKNKFLLPLMSFKLVRYSFFRYVMSLFAILWKQMGTNFKKKRKKRVTLYFTMSLLDVLHVVTAEITINYA